MFNVGIFLILLLSSALILVYPQAFTHQSITLLALQSAQAQENSLQNGIDLNGIWKRDDGVQVYFTQTGTQVISSFETEGNEREGDCSSVGMANVKSYLDFYANIEDNQLTGETNVCVIEMNNVQLYPMHLTMSDNGNTLTGTYEYEGGSYPISYIKTTTTSPPILNSLPPALVNFGRVYITNPNTDKVLLPVALGNFAWNYVKASNTDPVSMLTGLGAVFVAIVAGSYAIKKIHKHSKSHKKDKEQKEEQKLHVIRLAINCDLENITEAKEIENLQSINEIKRIEKEFRTVLGAILEGREKLKKLQKAKDFVEWCREAKEDPNTIISKISNDIIGNFIGCIEPYFASLFLKSISIESQTVIINKDKETNDQSIQNRYVNFNAKFNLKPLEPFIKLTLLIDEVPTSSVRLIFSIDTSVNMNNATVYSSNEGTKIVVESINIGLQLSFSRLVISHYLNKSIEMPIVLGNKEFGIKSLPMQ